MGIILDIAKAIEKSVEECLEDRVGIAFSGGIDSTVIASIAKKRSETFLFTAGVENSEDFFYAESVAKELNLPLIKIILDKEKIFSIYEKIYSFYPALFLKIEIGIPIYAVCEEAKKNNIKVVLFGSGSEELFVGYDRYYKYLEEGKDLDKILLEEFEALKDRDIEMIRKICFKNGIEGRFPFYNKKIANLVFSIPLKERMADKELKKGILREVARFLSVPEIAIKRRKKALQYGSGIHKIIMKNLTFVNEKFPPKLNV